MSRESARVTLIDRDTGQQLGISGSGDLKVEIKPLISSVVSTGVFVGATATKLPGTPLMNRGAIKVFNTASGDLYIGGADVTINNGCPITAGMADVYDTRADIYGVYLAGSGDVRVLEVA